MLIVAAAVIYAIKLAFAGNWQQLVILVVVLLLVIWILSAFGLALPAIGGLK
jgi:hypothetical protein